MSELKRLTSLERSQLLRFGVAKPTAAQHDKTYGMFLTNNAVNALAQASWETCRVCMLDKHKAKKCQLRAALDELYIQGVEGTENECPYFQI